ncbi:hypoxanthine phosphoribosyltransferase [Lacihabitans sp. CCS-44]|uniref:hypoxanthine phosphoribosyltransferase n=1 Tax=Lacihabitans sp. CCS-44 TaxID=2487331 RepID=UPI0020CC232E|nr:hypoxanthine phosphoribosyltransferase [Lacihabitans sp. CCS-44]MCP9753569.1 hypoxanthine phosphoribosyltransferase [Lacihabitans sp. CCS-44]
MVEVLDLKFKELITSEQIQERVDDISEKLNERFKGKNPVFLGILNGSFLFIADIFKKLTIPCEVSFLKIHSYQNTESTGKMKELIGLNQPIEGRHVVILEDIVDTGRTLDFLMKTLEIHNPASISVATLLHKPEAMLVPIQLDYVGFEIQNQFVVGYGLDYNGYGRNSSSILIKVDD